MRESSSFNLRNRSKSGIDFCTLHKVHIFMDDSHQGSTARPEPGLGVALYLTLMM